jgi:hypothetical protein
MASILSQILDRIDAILQASVPAGTLVLRDDVDPQSRSEAPWVNVLAVDQAVRQLSGDYDEHEDVVELQFGVRTNTSPTLAAEVVHSSVHGLIVVDATLRTFTESRRLVESSFDRQSADQTLCIKACRYRFIYSCPSNSI